MGGIKDYFDQLNADRGIVSVPEWGMTLYVGPLTVGQIDAIASQKSNATRNRQILLSLAKDETGMPAFQGQAIDELEKYGTADVVPRVADELVRSAPNADAAGREKKA